MDWHDLHKMKVTALREMAKEKLAIEGVAGLHKEELVAKLAEAMGIPRPHKVVDAEGKTAIKQRHHHHQDGDDGHDHANAPLQLTGRTNCDRIVVFDGNPRLVGQILPVTIFDTTPFTLIGEVVTEEAGPEVYSLGVSSPVGS